MLGWTIFFGNLTGIGFLVAKMISELTYHGVFLSPFSEGIGKISMGKSNVGEGSLEGIEQMGTVTAQRSGI